MRLLILSTLKKYKQEVFVQTQLVQSPDMTTKGAEISNLPLSVAPCLGSPAEAGRPFNHCFLLGPDQE